jgi:hypothetical protein
MEFITKEEEEKKEEDNTIRCFDCDSEIDIEEEQTINDYLAEDGYYYCNNCFESLQVDCLECGARFFSWGDQSYYSATYKDDPTIIEFCFDCWANVENKEDYKVDFEDRSNKNPLENEKVENIEGEKKEDDEEEDDDEDDDDDDDDA